jgi:hypothetical protein
MCTYMPRPAAVADDDGGRSPPSTVVDDARW